jgi:hypothetical protein
VQNHENPKTSAQLIRSGFQTTKNTPRPFFSVRSGAASLDPMASPWQNRAGNGPSLGSPGTRLRRSGLVLGYCSRGLSGILAGFLTIYFGIRYFYQFLVFRAESRCSEVSGRVGAGNCANAELTISILKTEIFSSI